MNLNIDLGNERNILFASISGSLAHGSATTDSDIDIRGCYIEPTKNVLDLYYNSSKATQRLEDDDFLDMEFHEVGKYLQLLLKGGFTTIEPVFDPKIYVDTRYMLQLTAITKKCISQRTISSYIGYCDNLLKEWESRPEKHYEFGWRCVAQARRLLDGEGIEINSNKLTMENFFTPERFKNRAAFKMVVDELSEIRNDSNLQEEPDEYAIANANALLKKIRLDQMKEEECL